MMPKLRIVVAVLGLMAVSQYAVEASEKLRYLIGLDVHQNLKYYMNLNNVLKQDSNKSYEPQAAAKFLDDYLKNNRESLDSRFKLILHEFIALGNLDCDMDAISTLNNNLKLASIDLTPKGRNWGSSRADKILRKAAEQHAKDCAPFYVRQLEEGLDRLSPDDRRLLMDVGRFAANDENLGKKSSLILEPILDSIELLPDTTIGEILAKVVESNSDLLVSRLLEKNANTPKQSGSITAPIREICNKVYDNISKFENSAYFDHDIDGSIDYGSRDLTSALLAQKVCSRLRERND